MAGLNGNSKWVITILTFFLVVGGTVVGVTNAISSKADRDEVSEACNRLTAVERDAENTEKQLDRIEDKLDDIEKLLRDGRGNP